MKVNGRDMRTIWMEGGAVLTIDQKLLPHRFEIATLPDHRAVAAAIRDMTVRGAPAIGSAGAYGMAQAAQEAASEFCDPASRPNYMNAAHDLLRATRPTAHNLFYALDAVRAAIAAAAPEHQAAAARAEAERIADENSEACRKIGEHGAALIQNGMTILTHCNAGWLACVDWGTALAPIYAAHRAGLNLRVFADETRPRGQGVSLTAWELMQEGVDCAVIADNAAGHFMRRGEVNLCIVGADCIAANGDTANKIGTYEKALLARHNGIPFYVAAPVSTFNPAFKSGDDIPIEERDADEVLSVTGRDLQGNAATVRLGPEGARARNPAFDVTPAELITGIITEHGVIAATPEAIAALVQA